MTKHSLYIKPKTCVTNGERGNIVNCGGNGVNGMEQEKGVRSKLSCHIGFYVVAPLLLGRVFEIIKSMSAHTTGGLW